MPSNMALLKLSESSFFFLFSLNGHSFRTSWAVSRMSLRVLIIGFKNVSYALYIVSVSLNAPRSPHFFRFETSDS